MNNIPIVTSRAMSGKTYEKESVVAKKCLFCDKKIPNNRRFCGKKCMKNHEEYYKISMPKIFIKRLTFMIEDEQEIMSELSKFAARHFFSLDMVKKYYKNKKEEL